MPTPRPPRLRVTDELARTRTLDAGPESRVQLTPAHPGAPLLVLGVGPEPAAFDLSHRPAFWLDCPDFLAQMPTSWAVPAHWKQITPNELEPLLPHAEIWHYRAAPKLFPSFWGPVLAALHAGRLAYSPARAPERTDPVVILPRTTLMHRELAEAFAAHGLRVIAIDSDPAKAAATTLDILKNETVALFMSLNFEGLDAGGELFHLLRAQKIPVAAWLVDNPWHILSRIQQPWWRGVQLFVTDPSFVASLRAYGAESVSFLPLAAWDMPVTYSASSPPNPITFVGNSTFPQRDRFFSGLTLPASLWAEAQSLLDTATPPDLHWWQRRLHTSRMWPGLACRLPGFGAEQSALARRTTFLEACIALGLSVYGDLGWATRLSVRSSSTLHPPVAYYTALGGVYAQSRYTLNVTSLQLPCGLTQRHFDVWQAGGFLLTDRSPGLALFPLELTEPVSVVRACDLPAAVERLERDPALRGELQAAWQGVIRAKHRYVHRVGRIVDQMKCV